MSEWCSRGSSRAYAGGLHATVERDAPGYLWWLWSYDEGGFRTVEARGKSGTIEAAQAACDVAAKGAAK